MPYVRGFECISISVLGLHTIWLWFGISFHVLGFRAICSGLVYHPMYWFTCNVAMFIVWDIIQCTGFVCNMFMVWNITLCLVYMHYVYD